MGRYFDAARGREIIEMLRSLSVCERKDRLEVARLTQTIDQALLYFLARDPFIVPFLEPFGQVSAMKETATCPSCISPARKFTVSFPNHGARRRRVILCPLCDESSVQAMRWNLALDLTQLSEGRLSVMNTPPNCSVVLSLFTAWGANPKSYFFPWTDPGKPIELPPSLPLHPLVCQVLVARKLELGSVGFKFRKLSDGRYSTTVKPLDE